MAALAVVAVAASASLAACAPAAPDAGAPPVTVRVLVKLTQASDDGAAIAAAAAAVAGVPVRYAAATSVLWHALTLECASRDECDAALSRLRAAKSAYVAVERDERRQRHSM